MTVHSRRDVCRCGPGRTPCASCQAWARRPRHPESLLADAESPSVVRVACGWCGTVFALQTAQRGAWQQGHALYCSAPCRTLKKHARDVASQSRRKARAA